MQVNIFSSISRCAVHVDEMHMQVVKCRLVMEVRIDLVARDAESFLDCRQRFVTHRFKKRQVSCRQIAHCTQISLAGYCQAVQRAQVTLVELVVFLKIKV